MWAWHDDARAPNRGADETTPPMATPGGCAVVRCHDRDAARRFMGYIHLDTSGYCPAALELQISELCKDFPALYDDALFAEGACWVALPPSPPPPAPVADGLPPWAGVVGVHSDPDEPGSGYLGFLAVHPAYRGQGLGEVLLVTALDEARRREYPTVSLVSLRCFYAAAVRLYERAGFVSAKEDHYTGEVPPGTGGCAAGGAWEFDVTWLALDMRGWHGALAPRGAAPHPRGVGRPLPQGPFDWPGRAARMRDALAPWPHGGHSGEGSGEGGHCGSAAS